uniref:Putative methyltransferase n=1 Tax=viral metagenome TaxID=1070528 RepID=A0A6M3LH75_9ZZZZ
MVGCTVLDVGSRQVSGKGGLLCYRPLFKDYDYVGMDIVAGDNVDIVGYDALQQYDVVISGQVMEHVKQPWEWLKTLKQLFKKYLCIITPHTARIHRYPYDTYRYFPDGMRDLFEWAGIQEEDIWMGEKDTVGIGKK